MALIFKFFNRNDDGDVEIGGVTWRIGIVDADWGRRYMYVVAARPFICFGFMLPRLLGRWL